MSALHRAVSGASNDVPRIVAFAWEVVDCSPALAAELLEAGISTGALEVRLDPEEERQQVRRLATRDRGLAQHRERNEG